MASTPASAAPAAPAPEQPPLLRAAASHPLLVCACRRETAARWRGVSGVDVDLLIVPLPAGVRATAGLGGVTWRSRRLSMLTAGCSALLLATSHAGQPHPAGASERHPPALLLRLKQSADSDASSPVGAPPSEPRRPAAAAAAPAAILDQADGSDGPLVCSCRAQPVV
jgi:hypothetical protein